MEDNILGLNLAKGLTENRIHYSIYALTRKGRPLQTPIHRLM